MAKLIYAAEAILEIKEVVNIMGAGFILCKCIHRICHPNETVEKVFSQTCFFSDFFGLGGYLRF